MTWSEHALSLGILHEAELAQVFTLGKLVMMVTVAIVHQTPAPTYQGEHTRTLYIALGGLAESVEQFPRLVVMQVFEHILANTLVLAILLGLEEKVIEAFLILHDVGVNRWCSEIEQHLRFALEIGKILIGITPIDPVVGNAAAIGQQREINHVLACLLVIERLRSPHTGHVGKRSTCKAFREMDGMVFPVHQVA